MKNLKKKIWVIGLFLVVATAVSFHINTEKSRLDALMFENVEALASDEWGPNVDCVGSGSLDCPRIHVKVYFIANALI